MERYLLKKSQGLKVTFTFSLKLHIFSKKYISFGCFLSVLSVIISPLTHKFQLTSLLFTPFSNSKLSHRLFPLPGVLLSSFIPG